MPPPPTMMDNLSVSPEHAASAYSGIVFATTAMAAAGCALGAATIIAAFLWHHPIGQQLTGFKAGAFLIIPLITSLVPIALMLLGRRKSKPHDHSYGHCSH